MYTDRREIDEIITKVMEKQLKSFFNKLLGKSNDKEERSETMTTKEVSDYLRVSKVTIYNWIKKGKIASKKSGNTRLFQRTYIETFKNSSDYHH